MTSSNSRCRSYRASRFPENRIGPQPYCSRGSASIAGLVKRSAAASFGSLKVGPSRALKRAAGTIVAGSDIIPLPSADWPDGQRMLPSQIDLFGFMADHKGFALTQRVFDFFLANFDFQHLAAIRHWKPKYRVVLRRATWPERQRPVIVAHAAEPICQHHPGAAH